MTQLNLSALALLSLALAACGSGDPAFGTAHPPTRLVASVNSVHGTPVNALGLTPPNFAAVQGTTSDLLIGPTSPVINPAPMTIYSVMPNGDLKWNQFSGNDNGEGTWAVPYGKVIGTGWSNLKQVFTAGNNNTLFAVTPNGDLKWNQYYGEYRGKSTWAALHGVVLGTGWGDARQVFADTTGAFYALMPNGELKWNRNFGFNRGTAEWEFSHGKVIGTGWGDVRLVFTGSNGVIYTVMPNGELRWNRYDGYGSGAGSWASTYGKVIGTGWGNVTQAFASGNGVIYAVMSNGDLKWNRFSGEVTGEGVWSSPYGKVVGTGWNTAVKVLGY